MITMPFFTTAVTGLEMTFPTALFNPPPPNSFNEGPNAFCVANFPAVCVVPAAKPPSPIGKKTSTRCLGDVFSRQARHLADVQKMS